MMSNQSLRYVFPFSQFSFDMEIGFLLLVEGKQSLFFTVGSPHVFTSPTILLARTQQTDISLPLQPQNKDPADLYKSEPEIKIPDQGQLDNFRDLLSGARRRERSRVSMELVEVRQREILRPWAHTTTASLSNMILWKNANGTIRSHNMTWR